ncbi:MAG: ribonucleotide reductase N-terminal alpha domain-containing protein, partial [Acidobacteriota bacterium]
MPEPAGFSENAIKILKARYYMRNERGEFLDKEPADLFHRVAGYIASAEKTKKDAQKWAGKFFEAMTARDFLPNSPTLTGAARDMCLSACFVLPIEDALDSIFETVKHAALVHKEGGGTGFDFSRLRPKGSFVRKTQGIASGPVSFLRVIDSATEAVKQGGTRRGANMGILRVDHPDVEEFIRMKIDGRSVNNFNISVAATDAFMEALKNDRSYDIYDPYHKKVVGQKNARQVFNLIVESAWAVGDPGLVFIDRVNARNPTKGLGPIRATNPCGEQPLHEYESCNLGSISLSHFFSPQAKDQFDWERFGQTISLAVRFLDDVID